MKDNRPNSLSFATKYVRILFLGHPQPRATLSENFLLLGTIKVRVQISEHIFVPVGGCCLFSNLLVVIVLSIKTRSSIYGNAALSFHRSFDCSVCETIEHYKEGYLMCGQTIFLLATLLLGYTLRVLVTSYQLPWQHTSSTKTSIKFQFMKLSEKLILNSAKGVQSHLKFSKTNLVTSNFYFFVGKFAKFFNCSDSLEVNFLMELNIFKENAFQGYLHYFPRNVYI